jgi:protoporphyrinogen oxidase
MLFTKRKRRKDVVKSFTFEGGLQRITDALVSRQRFVVMTGSEARKLSFDGKDFLVTCSDGRAFVSSALALATPVVAATGLMRELSPEISSLLSGVEAASVESAGAVVRRNSLGLKPVAGMIPKNDSFFSMVSRDVVPDASFRGFTFHFRPGLLDRDGKVARICEVLHLRTTDIEDFAERENIVPSLTLGHSRLVRQLDRLLGRNRILITGNYFAGLATEDCVSRSLSEFERLKTLL